MRGGWRGTLLQPYYRQPRGVSPSTPASASPGTGDPRRCGGFPEAACGARKKSRRAEPAASGRRSRSVASGGAPPEPGGLVQERAGAGDLAGNSEEIRRILPGARSVVVMAAPHSRGAIESADVQAAQYDTIHVYGEAARASHAVARWLERKGHRAVAVPAFIPIDMSPPKRGSEGGA